MTKVKLKHANCGGFAIITNQAGFNNPGVKKFSMGKDAK